MYEYFKQIFLPILNAGSILTLIIFFIKKYIDNKFSKNQIQFQLKLNELNFYKRHYYEKEFEVYREVTKAALKCAQNTSNLFPALNRTFKDKDREKERLLKLYSEAGNSLSNLIDVIYENYPFFPVDIFEKSKDLKNVCNKIYKKFEIYMIEPLYNTDLLDGSLPKGSSEFNNEIKEATDEVLKLIRNNVDSYRENERDS